MGLRSKCSESMRIISFIEDDQLVKKILKHLDLWDVKRKSPPCATARRLNPLLSMIKPQRPERMITSSMLTI